MDRPKIYLSDLIKRDKASHGEVISNADGSHTVKLVMQWGRVKTIEVSARAQVVLPHQERQ